MLSVKEQVDAATAEIYRRHVRGMVAVVARRLGPTAGSMATTIAETEFADLFSAGALKPDISSLPAFLNQAAFRAAVDVQRAASRQMRWFESIEEQHVQTANPENASDGEEPGELLQRILAGLSQADQQILRLALGGLKLSEIGTRLNVTYSAAAQRYHRALARAREVAKKR